MCYFLILDSWFWGLGRSPSRAKKTTHARRSSVLLGGHGSRSLALPPGVPRARACVVVAAGYRSIRHY